MSNTVLKCPQHLAIVMDGNGRWAKKRRLPAAAGHKAGVETVRKVLRASRELGIKHLTLFAFSSENWRRPELEVRALMSLFSSYLDNEIEELASEAVRVRFIGRRDRFSKSLLKKIEFAESETASNSAFTLTLAVDYGGQWDIANAARQLASEVAAGTLAVNDIDEDRLDALVSLSDLPAPDLMIRTSGEHRISNYLLWQLAYSEFYFTDVLWPDFGRDDLVAAIQDYTTRDRRYGGRNETNNA
ncbi:Ditrans,polycis-undecaprenyl-diphosphate synthase ((2E,6E)-farnesyl-diphosphate specific) [BD1-7 clade bacterium]|uniref:Ditrans,polycis-undecaprenyl-diphosphate synthase ((2E,6E)-farnesyl-diphosphate specific) n=1 Tax=BD1-7 clade bacterium TaxID=2029982 RepID=A0A5S9QBM7_9GAMM|nr:Ditrans,polycis-undecaprenyl-diphosphate synthase ((2E,6E)-farnesyl-diphosphate specific) [BD1-7 clade bacterium]CAA0119326.1 Ditrans,polycis-undecaprenyl-diphosphate synthase ((2E,6E)-farnesyl-diphosphate specific) [BD1-7 clade bacterium]